MAKVRRRRKVKPKKIIQIAAASSEEGPVLYALTDEGEVFEYGSVEDEDLGAEVGMWEQLSTIEPRNIVDDIEVDDDED